MGGIVLSPAEGQQRWRIPGKGGLKMASQTAFGRAEGTRATAEGRRCGRLGPPSPGDAQSGEVPGGGPTHGASPGAALPRSPLSAVGPPECREQAVSANGALRLLPEKPPQTWAKVEWRKRLNAASYLRILPAALPALPAPGGTPQGGSPQSGRWPPSHFVHRVGPQSPPTNELLLTAVSC